MIKKSYFSKSSLYKMKIQKGDILYRNTTLPTLCLVTSSGDIVQMIFFEKNDHIEILTYLNDISFYNIHTQQYKRNK